ncbi:MAG: lipopolysaccharide biosynthesis protein [Bacteroidales bacterium]|nr:lipopolysaccharide biosynthesis protein [Bacteroidales bacterium]
MEIKWKTLHGLRWSVINQVLTICLRFGFSIILARLLSPEEFGLVAMVKVFVIFLLSTTRLGINVLIIKNQAISHSELSSLFWFQLVRGLIVSIVFYLMAKLISSLYNNSSLTLIAKVYAPIFFISACNNTHWSLIKKNIDFKTITRINTTSLIISNIVAIIIAYLGGSYWSLVCLQLLNHLLRLTYTWIISIWNPGLYFNKSFVVSTIRKGMHIAGLNAISSFSKNIDSFIIGKYVGNETLGIYNKAYSMITHSTQRLTANVSGVMLPSFSMLQNDMKRFSRIYTKIFKTTLMVILPFIVILLVQTENIILLTYGKKWLAMAPFVRMFGVLAFFNFIFRLNYSVFNALGRHKLAFRIGLINKLIVVSSIIVGFKLYGTQGIIIGYIISSALSSMFEAYYLGKIIDIRIIDFVNASYKIFLSNIFVLAIGIIANKFLTLEHYLLELCIITIPLLSIYAALLFLFKKDHLQYLWYLLKSSIASNNQNPEENSLTDE